MAENWRNLNIAVIVGIASQESKSGWIKPAVLQVVRRSIARSWPSLRNPNAISGGTIPIDLGVNQWWGAMTLRFVGDWRCRSDMWKRVRMNGDFWRNLGVNVLTVMIQQSLLLGCSGFAGSWGLEMPRSVEQVPWRRSRWSRKMLMPGRQSNPGE